MARTYIAYDPRSGSRGVVIEVRPELLGGASAQEVEGFMRRIDSRHITSGLLITPSKAYFVRDMFKTMDFSPQSYNVKELPTAKLFSLTHGGEVEPGELLYDQVRGWLEAVADSWFHSVSDESMDMMLPWMVGALSQARFEERSELLDAEE